jgi:hypothetical protein
MESSEIQQMLFQQIKVKIPANLSFVDAISELLNISHDSAYRRIRGEKPLTFEELQKLCIAYKLSLDQMLHHSSNGIVFYGSWVDAMNFDFDKYLKDWHNNLVRFNSAKEKMLLYDAKDIPLFHHYQFRYLSTFKFFFWMRTILSYEDYLKISFEDYVPDENLLATGQKIIETYNKIPSAEIWTFETINSTLRQIEYYKESGIFKNKESVARLYEEVEMLIAHIKEQARCGEKFLYGQKPTGTNNNYRLFFNEVSTGHNTVLTDTDGKTTVFLNHGVMNYMITQDPVFCEFTRQSLENTMQKSSLISSVSEKERNRFFMVLNKKIINLKNDLAFV